MTTSTIQIACFELTELERNTIALLQRIADGENIESLGLESHRNHGGYRYWNVAPPSSVFIWWSEDQSTYLAGYLSWSGIKLPNFRISNGMVEVKLCRREWSSEVGVLSVDRSLWVTPEEYQAQAPKQLPFSFKSFHVAIAQVAKLTEQVADLGLRIKGINEEVKWLKKEDLARRELHAQHKDATSDLSLARFDLDDAKKRVADFLQSTNPDSDHA